MPVVLRIPVFESGVNQTGMRRTTGTDRLLYTLTDGGGACTGGGVNAHSAHAGGSVNAVAESRTDKNIPKYLACKYIMKVK